MSEARRLEGPPSLASRLGCSPDTTDGNRLSPDSASRIHELEASLGAAREALRAIAENAEAWHGPPPDMGHVRALAVIATTARGALAGGDNAEGQESQAEDGSDRSAFASETASAQEGET